MAVQDSTEYALQVATDSTRAKLMPYELSGRKRHVHINHTFTGTPAAGDELNLIILPPRHKVILYESFYKLSASFGAGATFDIGFRAFTNEDGTAQAEVVDSYVNAADATLTVRTALTPSGTSADAIDTVLVNARDGEVTLFLTELTDAPALNDVLDIVITYVETS